MSDKLNEAEGFLLIRLHFCQKYLLGVSRLACRHDRLMVEHMGITLKHFFLVRNNLLQLADLMRTTGQRLQKKKYND
jgi:hypothetical protein